MNHSTSTPTLAKHLMNADAVPLRPGKFEKDLVWQFLSGQYSGWPVVDHSCNMLGIVTEFRLLQAVSRLTSLADLNVEDTMSAPVYVGENDPLDFVVNVMIQKQILRIPVVSHRDLVGVISRGQVLRQCLPLSSASTQLISSCAWCERVQDPSEGSARSNGWGDLTAFLAKPHLSYTDIDLARTYCPSCLRTLQALRGTAGTLSSDETKGKEDVSCLLVVDDDPSVAGMLREALQEWGYEVLVARNGREGLDMVGRYSVAGILLDMHMPVMDGRTMLDELRWLQHQMPVLMMSGGSDEQTLRQLLQEGAQGFFLKPFHLTSLKQLCHQTFPKNGIPKSVPPQCQVA